MYGYCKISENSIFLHLTPVICRKDFTYEIWIAPPLPSYSACDAPCFPTLFKETEC